MKIHSENYITIQGFMRTELNLTGNDLLVYAIIYGASQDGESKYTGSLQYLADWCGATKQGIQKNLKNLLDKGLIKKETRDINGMTLVAYYTTELHRVQLSCINNISISSNNNNNQYNLIQDNNITNKEDTYKEKVEKFVADYNSICISLPKCTRISEKRRKGIIHILKKYSDKEILEVFNKLEASDFCTGRNGSWRADIEFILREDKFINVLEGKYDNRKARCNVETISHGDKKQLSAEERERIIRNGQKF